jgi:hypothetical protein
MYTAGPEPAGSAKAAPDRPAQRHELAAIKGRMARWISELCVASGFCGSGLIFFGSIIAPSSRGRAALDDIASPSTGNKPPSAAVAA